MGMFDNIKVDMPFEGKRDDVEWYQSKDVPNDWLYLEKWTIKADGTLVKHGVRYEDQSDPNADGLLKMAGMCTPIPEPEKDETHDFHGDIGFGFWNNENDHADFIARFTEGKCTRIWKVER